MLMLMLMLMMMMKMKMVVIVMVVVVKVFRHFCRHLLDIALVYMTQEQQPQTSLQLQK